jgi:phosphate transport system substrate-binding protein
MTARNVSLLLAAACCISSSSCASPGESVQGAGATFPAPLYKRWFLEYYKRDPHVRVNYQAIGSGAGIRQFTEGLVAFGASDAAMSDKEIALFKKERGSDVQLLPMTAGSVVICYNLPEVSGELRLSRDTYLRIFLGEITSWDDSAVRRDNPNAKLPDREITVVRRADGSGTTYAFTNHLDSVGKSLGKKWTPGVGKSITWPKREMIGGRGNPGVAALIKQTPGAIGYLELGYAELAELPMAVLKNKAGSWVAPTPESSLAALEGVPLPKDFRIWVPDPAGRGAYPIVTYTWLLCYKKYKDPKVADTLKKVLKFCLTEGQTFSKDLGYIPLPKDVAEPVLKAVDAIEVEGSAGAARR